MTTRFAQLSDLDRIVDFIRDEWRHDHVFVTDPELLVWQHGSADGRLNFVIAEGEGSELMGLLGFIPTGRFSPALGEADLLLAIWKVRTEDAPPGLGLHLLKFLTGRLRPRLIGAIGISDIVRPIYRVLGYETGTMRHEVLLNPRFDGRFRIADGVAGVGTPSAGSVEATTVTLDPVGSGPSTEVVAAIDRFGAEATPAKDWDYLRQRFLEHPWYEYDVRLVRVDGHPVAAVVARAVRANGSTALRIVDVVGDVAWFAGARRQILELADHHDAEYVDLVHFGVDAASLSAAGFVNVPANGALVVPNYFSPFERRNVQVDFAFKQFSGGGAVRLFRADSDQDRPNSSLEVGRSADRAD